MKSSTKQTGALERRVLMLCLLLVAVGLGLAVKMPQHIAAMEEDAKYTSEFYEFADLFFEVYSQVRQRYVKEVPSKQLFQGAIDGMFATLDPHSGFLPPREQESLLMDTEGEYSGVGLHITLDKQRILTVISPIPGSPSSKVGIMPWDRIVEIEGKSTKGIMLDDAVQKLTGPTGSKVKVKVWREGVPALLDFTLTRQNIRIMSVFSKVMDDGIGYLRIAKFQDDTANDVRKILKEFNSKHVQGVIVDLRNDAGGLLERAVEICDLFLPKDQVIVSIRGRGDSNNRVYYSLENPTCTQPMIVLVNHGSASASEIFAGAMKDTRRGVIMGPKDSKTFGKGSVQTIISPLKHTLEYDENGDKKTCGIRLTTALYYTPSGESIHEKGIKPDIGVELPKTHEYELMRHGLLGDPSMIEPELKANDEATTTSAEKPAEEAPADETPAPESEIMGMPQSPEKKADREFRDILLDEAVKYLKAFLILESRKAA